MKAFGLISNAKRMRHIMQVLWRNGYDELLQKVEAPSGLRRWITPKPRAHYENKWTRLRITLEELGPTFVKFGQILSMRPDALPEPLIVELRKLQANVTVQPFDEMEPVLQRGLNGADFTEVFSEFDRTPIASASMAQVYFARLRSNGQPVAVKVQRPGISKTIESDFNILRWLAVKANERIEDLRPYDLPGIIAELRRGLDQELDFRIEARNTDFFNHHNPDEDKVFAPKIYGEVSSETVLVMERIDGLKLSKVERGSALAKAVAARGAASLFHQILVLGFFHADPHAGNLVVAHDGRLCFLDWGLAGQLTTKMRYTLVDMFEAFLSGDSAQVVRVALELDRTGASQFNSRMMEREILYAMRDTFNIATGKGEIGRAMLRLLHILGENGIAVAQDYALVAKAVFSIEEEGNSMDPDFSLLIYFKPALAALMKDRYKPSSVFKNFRRSLFAGLGRLQDMPTEILRVLRMFESGTATINFQHKGLEQIDSAMNSASNRLTMAIIIAAMIIGSSLIVATRIPPLLYDVSVLGIVGYLISAMFGLWIVFDILRYNRHR